MEEKNVYMISEEKNEMKNALGEKSINLAEMMTLGLSVPQGFTISSNVCVNYFDNDEKLFDSVLTEIYDKLKILEQASGKQFGSVDNPLLLSVRAGISIPGVVDSVLNVGLTSEIEKKYEEKDEKFALDSYRVFIQMYGSIVKNIDKKKFVNCLNDLKREKNAYSYYNLQTCDVRTLVEKYKEIYKEEVGEDFPDDPHVQLRESIGGLYRLWNNSKLLNYKQQKGIKNNIGLPLIIQEMIFGNYNDNSGTGIVFSRNPENGDNFIYGHYLKRSQGEDIIFGANGPEIIDVLKGQGNDLFNEIMKDMKLLENHFKDMQYMQFTIEDGKLYFLFTKNGNRTPMAALKIATDLVDEKKISEQEALLKLTPKQIYELFNNNSNSVEDIYNNNQLLRIFMNWVDKYRNLNVKANVCTLDDANLAYNFGAEGIGLYRTENLLENKSDEIEKIVELNENVQNKIQNKQKEDFIELFKSMHGYPVTIRLFDIKSYNIFNNDISTITYIQSIKMQIKAIFDAATSINDTNEMNIVPEIMVPFVANEEETKYIKDIIDKTIKELSEQSGKTLKYSIGVMIETPRASLLSNEIARQAKFFVFGLDKLTQLTFGVNSDEINQYDNENICEIDLFNNVEENSVGKLLNIATESGRKTRADIRIGLTKENTITVKTIEYCEKIGLSCISCKPREIPIVKFVAAQSAIKKEKQAD